MNADRFKAAIAGIVAELLPERAYLAPARYRVSKAEGGKFSGAPVSRSRGLPPAVDWPIGGSIAGGHTGTKLRPGSIAIVIFLDGDPSSPRVVGLDDSEPLELALEAELVSINGGAPAARMGDAVIAGPFPGTIVAGSARTRIG